MVFLYTERFRSGDGEEMTLNRRQVTFEPLPASDLFWLEQPLTLNMKFLEDILYHMLGLIIRTVIGGTFGWAMWNHQWHDWFAAPLATWTQACGAVFIANLAAGDFRRSQNTDCTTRKD